MLGCVFVGGVGCLEAGLYQRSRSPEARRESLKPLRPGLRVTLRMRTALDVRPIREVSSGKRRSDLSEKCPLLFTPLGAPWGHSEPSAKLGFTLQSMTSKP